jgi:hypothetical protein
VAAPVGGVGVEGEAGGDAEGLQAEGVLEGEQERLGVDREVRGGGRGAAQLAAGQVERGSSGCSAPLLGAGASGRVAGAALWPSGGQTGVARPLAARCSTFGGGRSALGDLVTGSVSFKAPWRSGTAHADMDAHQFLARLCALVPPPGFHMTRYYGVFASHHRLRERVIPKPAAPPPPPQLALDFALADDSPSSSPSSSPRPRRIAWAKLLARIFALDITRCRKCGGRMRVLEVVSDPDAIARILHGARAPPAPPPPGQLLLLP